MAVAALWLALGVNAAAADEVVQSSSSNDWSNLTLEQLVNIQVTSVSKKQTDLFKSPAAIYVITQEDIRRSGLTSIPELLRMVPGLDVAQIDANHWAITARGFNWQYNDKLLVLIDGRTVYVPEFAGVCWNMQDVPLENIDRIEVIRGPGATLWGANAVNGVINIITKSAKDTQGGLASVTYGTEDQPSTTVRYGGELGTNLFYRVYMKYFDREGFVDAHGNRTADDWNATHGGFRVDWEPSDINRLTLQGDYYCSDAGETVDLTTLTPPFVNRVNVVDHNNGGNLLSRWTHDFSETSQLTLQTYFDYIRHVDAPVLGRNEIYDFDMQHRFALGDRQDIVWGLGYRYLEYKITTNFYLSFRPPGAHNQVFSAFAQDEITIVPERLHLTLGSKFEHNDFTGFEVQPSARLAWTPTDKQTVWAAVSRAVRTPSVLERDLHNNRVAFPSASGPVLVTLEGNPEFKSEELLAYELGYRVMPIKQLSFDATAFYNVYDRLRQYVQGAPQMETTPPPPHLMVPLTAENGQRGETYGAELLAEWQATDKWKWVASYTFLEMYLHPDQLPGQSFNHVCPQNQIQLRSYLDLPHHVELNGAVYYVDQVYSVLGVSQTRVPSYVRLDLGVTWRPIPSLEIGIWGQNLVDDGHPEYTNYKTTLVTEVPRSVLGKVTWRF